MSIRPIREIEESLELERLKHYKRSTQRLKIEKSDQNRILKEKLLKENQSVVKKSILEIDRNWQDNEHVKFVLPKLGG